MLLKTKLDNTQTSTRHSFHDQNNKKVKLTLFHSNQTYASLNCSPECTQLYVLVLLLPVNKMLSVMRQKTLSLDPKAQTDWCFSHFTNSFTFLLFLLVCLWKATNIVSSSSLSLFDVQQVEQLQKNKTKTPQTKQKKKKGRKAFWVILRVTIRQVEKKKGL